jgi:hypothetical protein
MAEELQSRVPQPDQDTIRYETFTGLRNDRPIERFEHTDLAAGTNIDIDNSGAIARRPGYTPTAITTATHSVWSDNTQCLLVNGGVLNSVSSTYALTPLKTLTDATARVSYAKINNRVYLASEKDTGVVENGIARTWGIQVPPLPGVSVTVGNMSAGAYQFVVTYVRADGQESGATLAGRVDVVDGSGINFAMPVSTDPGVTGKNLYLSTPNGDVMYLAMRVPNTQLTALYNGTTLELNLPLLTQFLGPAPTGQLVVYYSGHLFVASGDMLYPSEPLALELFDLRKGIAMDGRITMAASMEDKERQGVQQGMDSGLFMGTDRSCGVLIGKDDFQYVPKIDYGAIEGAMAYVDGSLYGDNAAGARLLPMWLTSQGICVGLPQMNIKNLTRTRYGFTAAGKGSGIFQPGPNKLILTSNF